MHFHHCLLVEAADAEEALSVVEHFLDSYGDEKVWDWYVTTDSGRFCFQLADDHMAYAVSAKNKKFFDIIKTHEGYVRGEIKDCENEIRKYETIDELLNTKKDRDLYYLGEWADLKRGDVYKTSTYFFDTINHLSHLTDDMKKTILKNPKQYWIISCDLHN